MEVTVDGERDFQVQGQPETMLAVAAAASDFLQERGRAVMSIRIDGTNVPLNGMAEALEHWNVASVARVEFESEPIRDLVATCLDELAEVLPDLPNACHSLAEVFQGDTPEEGYAPFTELAEIWRHIKVREAEVVHALELDLEGLEANATPFKTHHDELNGILGEAAQALENLDCVLLGDLLEYELAPRAEAEAAIVAVLQQKAAELDG